MNLSFSPRRSALRACCMSIVFLLLNSPTGGVSAHSNNDDFWWVNWFQAFSFSDPSGEVMSVRYRDHGLPDYHCPYVQSRRGINGRISESPLNCSTRNWSTHRQGLLAVESGAPVWQPGWWRVCRSGHWTCRAWHVER